jgi:hypothetical protein
MIHGEVADLAFFLFRRASPAPSSGPDIADRTAETGKFFLRFFSVLLKSWQ